MAGFELSFDNWLSVAIGPELLGMTLLGRIRVEENELARVLGDQTTPVG